jgi:proton-dependent oligopeptide transporter, POT family
LTATDGGALEPRKTFLGHPRGLVILFFTEMWERFSYYGMRALLTLYLVQHFLFSQGEAAGIYASYAALVYLLPLVGGAIADRYLGARKAVTIGAILLVAGHFTMAFEGSGGREYIAVGGQDYEVVAEGRGQNRQLFVVEGSERTPISISPEGVRVLGEDGKPVATPAPATAVATAPSGFPVSIAPGGYTQRVESDTAGQTVLFLALALIAVGVGFLKPNISTVVGALYEQDDPRRDGGFTIFYVGINLGSFLASAACAYLGFNHGWAYGFGLAGIGMALGLVTFLLGQKWLEGRAEPPQPEQLKSTRILGVPLEAALYIGGLIAVIPTWMLMQRHALVEHALLVLVPAIFVALIVFTVVWLKGTERSRMLVALILTMFSVLFWALFEQAGSSLTLYANDFSAMPSWFNAGMTQTFNPGTIVVFGPIMAGLWVWMAKRRIEPNTPMKFSFALMLLGLGYLVLVYGNKTQADATLHVGLIWLFLAYFFHTIGELCLSPVGLSMITKLSVARMVGLMMGAWFMASALAHTVAGQIAKLTAADTIGGVVTDRAAALATFSDVYQTIGLISVATGVVLLIASPLLRKMMAGVR